MDNPSQTFTYMNKKLIKTQITQIPQITSAVYTWLLHNLRTTQPTQNKAEFIYMPSYTPISP